MTSRQENGVEEVTDALLAASRALVGVAASSLAEVSDEVTLVQFRALVILAREEEHSSVQLAELLEVSPSSSKRMVDRLVARGLVRREQSETSRREVSISLTDDGRSLVQRVMRRRRRILQRIVTNMPSDNRQQLVVALCSFAEAAGESSDEAWSLGWLSD